MIVRRKQQLDQSTSNGKPVQQEVVHMTPADRTRLRNDVKIKVQLSQEDTKKTKETTEKLVEKSMNASKSIKKGLDEQKESL